MTPALAALAHALEATAYRLVRPLARGGMGDVVVVEHKELSELRVMKLVRVDRGEARGLADRLRAEARVMTRLRHPHLVRVLDCGRLPDERVYVVTELLEGETVAARLRASGALGVPEAVRLGAQLCEGLSVVHEAEIVHRDIKPDNLFLTRDGDLKILDFGIAKFLSEEARRVAGPVPATATAMILGTPGYIAPEQLRGEAVDARVDLYAAGCVIYAMLVGRPPFESTDPMQLFRAHLFDPPPPTRAGLDVDRWVARALAKSPAHRFATAMEMRTALLRIQSSRAFFRPETSAGRNLPPQLATEFLPAPNPRAAPSVGRSARDEVGQEIGSPRRSNADDDTQELETRWVAPAFVDALRGPGQKSATADARRENEERDRRAIRRALLIALVLVMVGAALAMWTLGRVG